ncbi:hypothetical protein C8046_06510 [Serinibacter arcticus]|uniref:Uncharacterized protein n=1 Tax=Serinibacter arcticus TaxID=1655435 RepID=A0A2U1ZTP8_9MICO|nr:hypothetical protein [Serinibacter arcticus]PWD50358.1 hypothetical protein C8046_06510 [Serinibacter arcticus]
MSHLSRTIWASAAAATLALGLTACGSDGGGGGGGGGGDLSYEDSPLAVYFGAGQAEEDFDMEAEQARMDEENTRVEQLVAECMAEQGFEYTPNTNTGSFVSGPGMDEDYDPVENARQFGYGAFTYEDMAGEDAAEEYVDPNADYLESMSESEQTAFNEALWGPSVEYDEDAEMETEWNWEDSGCYGSAQHQVYEVESDTAGQQDVWSDPRWTELTEGINQLYTSMQEDPRLDEINTAWAECMADAGHPDHANPQAAMESIYELSNAQWEEHADDPEYMGPTGAELEELKATEIELATADYTCQEETDYADEQLRLQFEIEQEFVDENKAELEAFAEAMAGAQP